MNLSNITKQFILLVIIFVGLGIFNSANSQNSKKDIVCVGFYNVENLFDTNDDEGVKDTEFTAKGSKVWTVKRYNKKINNMAKVISQIGDEYMKGGPAILGVSEIENKGVLEDLIKTKYLENSNYKIVHYDSPDRRGIDVGLLYRADIFKVTSSRSVHFTVPDEINPYDDEFRSRDQLVVSGLLNGTPIHILVNHWPSRRGGEKVSSPLREAAGTLARSTADSILRIDPNAKIILMGDLNDDPINKSVVECFRGKESIAEMHGDDFFNTMAARYKRGIGTTAYRDSWSLFDQLIISPGLLKKDPNSYHFAKSKIFKKKFIIQKNGKFEGYPKRTFSFDKFQNGYSDHFPVYLVLIKNK